MNIREIDPTQLLGSINALERKHLPKTLFVSGEAGLLTKGTRVAIVGSRKASDEGLRRARALARALVEKGVVVVSGMAEGIDTAAHEAAMKAGGRTIAVLGTPLDKPYPASNRLLFQRIVKDQLAVSQFPIGQSVQRKNFPIRNRTMALLSDATVIVEAGQKSGTLHQGWEAIRLGRLVFLMESVANNPALTWPREMIDYGAQVLARDNLDYVIDNLPSLTAVDEVAW